MSRLGQGAPQGQRGQLARLDGFDEWVSSVARDTPRPPSARPSQPPQRLMGVADVLSSAHVTMGGPASAVPHKSMQESDFYVMKPAKKKPSKGRPTNAPPRTKLATSVFLFIIVAVLVGVTLAFFYLHH
jgi:hypothetical protein